MDNNFGYGSRLYWIWHNMKARCTNVKATGYEHYGGRGIRVFDDWQEYKSFRKWALDNGYNDDLTIDRVNVDGNYEPSNCRWANWKEQSNNKRSNHYYTYQGVTKTIKQWSEDTGINHETLRYRIMQGWSEEDVFGKNPIEPVSITYKGVTHTASDWAKIMGIRKNLILERLRRGDSAEKALTPQKFCEKKMLEYNGQKHSITEWAKITGISKSTISNRLKNLNWSVEDALSIKSNRQSAN